MQVRAAALLCSLVVFLTAASASAQTPYPTGSYYPPQVYYPAVTPAATPAPDPWLPGNYYYPPLYQPGALLNCLKPSFPETMDVLYGPLSITCSPLDPSSTDVSAAFSCALPDHPDSALTFNCELDRDGAKVCKAAAVTENFWMNLDLQRHYFSLDMGVQELSFQLNDCMQGKGSPFFEKIDVNNLRFGLNGDQVNYSCQVRTSAFSERLVCAGDLRGTGEFFTTDLDLRFTLADWQPFPNLPITVCAYAGWNWGVEYDLTAMRTKEMSWSCPTYQISANTTPIFMPGVCKGVQRGYYRISTFLESCPTNPDGSPTCGCRLIRER